LLEQERDIGDLEMQVVPTPRVLPCSNLQTTFGKLHDADSCPISTDDYSVISFREPFLNGRRLGLRTIVLYLTVGLHLKGISDMRVLLQNRVLSLGRWFGGFLEKSVEPSRR